MKYFSMFSGIGGFEYGIRKADIQPIQSDIPKRPKEYDSIENKSFKWECVGYSEIDKYAKSIYQYHFPDHTDWGDATKIRTKTLPTFDLLVAGFPCQAFSIAGKRQGFKDTRGTLFFEIARVLKDTRPRYFVLENVAGLLSHEDGETFQTILRILTEIGYRIEWQVLNSKDFGVPQNRERVFIIGHLGGKGGRKVFPITGKGNSNITISKSAKTSVARTLMCLGHSGGNHSGMTILSVPLRYLDRNQKNFPSEYSMCIDSSNTTGIMKQNRIRRLTPVECERLQGFPDNYTKYGVDSGGGTIKVSDTQRYKCLGNAVTTTVITAIIKKLSEDV